jgi:Transposase and inactivated derivatives
MQSVTKYIGLDVSKESIAVAIADAGREEPRFYGMITNSEKTLLSCLSRLGGEGIHLEVCYEAGPTGYAIFRWLQKEGISCSVIAPSLIPRKPGDRVKTDRKDALRLAQLLRAGELTSIYVPNEEDEALRDLVRGREDTKEDLLRAKHRILKFLMRHHIVAPKGKKWTKKYMNWLNTLTFANGNHQIVFQEYLRAMQEEEMRLKRLEEQIAREAKEGHRAVLIQALQVLKGVALLTAVTLVAEIGTFLRFPKASNFMGYTGLVPSEYSTGQTTRKGKTTKAGNKHVRRIVVESAWSYRYRPAVKGEILKRQENQPAEIQQIAWHCQHRLHSKYLKMVRNRGMHKNKVITAVARELSAFIWEIACVIERRELLKA